MIAFTDQKRGTVQAVQKLTLIDFDGSLVIMHEHGIDLEIFAVDHSGNHSGLIIRELNMISGEGDRHGRIQIAVRDLGQIIQSLSGNDGCIFWGFFFQFGHADGNSVSVQRRHFHVVAVNFQINAGHGRVQIGIRRGENDFVDHFTYRELRNFDRRTYIHVRKIDEFFRSAARNRKTCVLAGDRDLLLRVRFDLNVIVRQFPDNGREKHRVDGDGAFFRHESCHLCLDAERIVVRDHGETSVFSFQKDAL